MPLEVYFSWNRCKMAWSAGRLLEVLTAFELGDLDIYDSLYRCARRTYRHTFLGTRLADGSWGHELHDDEEAAIDQQTLEGISAVPTEEAWHRHRGHKVPFSSSIEITRWSAGKRPDRLAGIIVSVSADNRCLEGREIRLFERRGRELVKTAELSYPDYVALGERTTELFIRTSRALRGHVFAVARGFRDPRLGVCRSSRSEPFRIPGSR